MEIAKRLSVVVPFCLLLLLLINTVTAKAENTQFPPVIPQTKAPEGAPNIVVVLLDDVGFGATSTFGGPAETPALDSLAEKGLSYNRFHTTAICSPTRAALLTGRDAHVAGVGTVLNSANSYPGYEGVLKKETATIAQVLQQNGYSTAVFGKWHLTPVWETSPSGPFDRWPTGVGFDKFYGFLGGETDQFEPTLYDGTTSVLRPEGDDYHLTEDMADQAIKWMRVQKSIRPDKPFFVYFAPGATHAPLQVPKEWIERYKGRFSQGWDAMREEIFARQKQLGVIPADAELTPRPEKLPAWSSLSANEKKVAERLMETYVGFLAHTDAQVGRLATALKKAGQFDNTLFIYIVGDNGSSSEGGVLGSVNYVGYLQGLPEPTEHKLDRLDEIGNADTFPQYPAGWAWALTTPFQWVKQIASHLGGTRNPMVITWPKRIKDQGGLRSQFTHVNDIVPTILELVGIDMPEAVNGIEQLPMDGISLAYSFDDANAKEQHTTQYFEVFGRRGIYHNGWMASAFHGGMPWNVGVAPTEPQPFEDDIWELYNLNKDFSQSNDLAKANPKKLREMKALFYKEAERVGMLPLRNALQVRTPMPSLTDDREEFTYYPGAVGIPLAGAPNIFNRSWRMQAELSREGKKQPARGAIAAMGGITAGLSLYLDDKGRPVFHYSSFEAGAVTLVGKRPLKVGTHTLEVSFGYDGGGYGKGGLVTLVVDGEVIGKGRLEYTPPGFFSIDETFDIGIDTGSPAGHYPKDGGLGYRFNGGQIDRVVIQLM